jgi:hypothetical protein
MYQIRSAHTQASSQTSTTGSEAAVQRLEAHARAATIAQTLGRLTSNDHWIGSILSNSNRLAADLKGVLSPGRGALSASDRSHALELARKLREELRGVRDKRAWGPPYSNKLKQLHESA